MPDAKTRPSARSVAEYMASIEDERRRSDCHRIAEVMKRVTGCAPQMWGSSIVGFDSYHYRYASGHEGDSCVVGFSARKGDISVYLMAGYEGAEELLLQLGKHRIGKACLYLKRLSDIDLSVFEQLVVRSVAETKRMYPR
jgi:hypothetical protein